MAYSTTRNKRRRETTAQALARYKRQQRKQHREREARQAYERAALAPGGSKNPLTPSWCSFRKYREIMLSYRQVRYRGTTRIAAYLKGTQPEATSCPMTGGKKQIEVTRERWQGWMNTVSNVQFGSRWYRHPVTAASYEEFCERYVVFEENSKYLD